MKNLGNRKAEFFRIYETKSLNNFGEREGCKIPELKELEEYQLLVTLAENGKKPTPNQIERKVEIEKEFIRQMAERVRAYESRLFNS